MKVRKTFLFLLVPMLSACDSSTADLDSYIARTKASATVVAMANPTLPAFEAVPFSMDNGRDPFAAPHRETAKVQKITDCWQPDLSRTIGALEEYSLSNLRFKGVIGNKSYRAALIQMPDGEIRKASFGDYVGENLGKIDAIEQQGIRVTESLPDGLGCWQTRSVLLGLNGVKGDDGNGSQYGS